MTPTKKKTRANKEQGRVNQRRRTRKDLLRATSRLLKSGRKPTMDEVAEEAMVSRATVYRYFPSLEQLLAEAPLDDVVPDNDRIFAGDDSGDPEERVDKAEAAMHDACYRNEAALRVLLAHWITQSDAQSVKGGKRSKDTVPIRQNRRMDVIDAALAPARKRFSAATYKRLRAALCLIFGTESMVVFRDVLPLSEAEARRVKSWAVRALVRAALDDTRNKGKKRS